MRKVVLLSLLFLLVVAVDAAIACKGCCVPPPYNRFECCSQVYNGGNGCVISSFGWGQICDVVGQCQGPGGEDPCAYGGDQYPCTYEQWACAKPPRPELHLVAVETRETRVKRPARG